MILVATNQLLELLLGATGSVEWTAAWTDITSGNAIPGADSGVVTTTAAAAVLAAPAASTQRRLEVLTLFNGDTMPVSLTLRLNSASNYRRVWSGTIPPGGTLSWSRSGGWSVPGAGSGGQSGLRNRLINGAQEIDQANSGASVACGVGQNWITDQWAVACNQAGKLTAQRSAVAPAGFINSLCVTVASAYTPAAIDAFDLRQPIEGVNLVDLAWGTASAQPVAVSFWVRGSVPGTYAVSFRNGAVTRSYVALITIAAANTWERKTVTLPGCTDGVWATDNGVGLYLCWDLGHGSNYQASAGSWLTGSYVRTSACVSFVSQVAGSTLYLTGAQLERGGAATEFERRSGRFELAECHKYYWRGLPCGDLLFSAWTVNTYHSWPIKFPVTMRASPSLYLDTTGWTLTNASNAAIDYPTIHGCRYYHFAPIAGNSIALLASPGFMAADARL